MQPFIVNLNGSAPGTVTFEWHADRKFFEGFGNSEVLDADLQVCCEVERAKGFIGVECSIDGTLTVPCDRCFDDLVLPVGTDFALSVKFGEQEGRTDAEDREIVMLTYGSSELDLSQFIYDYVMTSLPMQRVHPEDECNPEAMKYLSK